MPDLGLFTKHLKQRWKNMQEHHHTDATMEALHPRERRQNLRKRNIVEYGVLVGEINLISGVEYLQSRGIEAEIIERVLLDLLTRRLSSHPLTEANSPSQQDQACQAG
jgi:hypothetical protein